MLAAACGAATIHVPGDYSTVQKAIDAAVNSDIVVVAPGSYRENIDFKGKALLVTSSGGPASTVIDGRKLDSVVKFSNGEGLDSVIEGFTITNGRLFSGCGIHCYQTSPTIRHNVITANVTDQAFIDSYGGGLYVGSGGTATAANNIIRDNWAAEGKQIFVQGNYGPDTLTILHSNVEGGLAEVYVAPGSTLNWQAGMIDLDPLFAA